MLVHEQGVLLENVVPRDGNSVVLVENEVGILYCC